MGRTKEDLKPAARVKCPHCGTAWELDFDETWKPEYCCEECGNAFEIEKAKVTEDGKKRRKNAESGFWKWVFGSVVGMHAAMLCFELVTAISGSDEGWIGLRLIFGWFLFVTYVFLLFGSPFFFRRAGWVAIIGWSLAMLELALVVIGSMVFIVALPAWFG